MAFQSRFDTVIIVNILNEMSTYAISFVYAIGKENKVDVFRPDPLPLLSRNGRTTVWILNR